MVIKQFYSPAIHGEASGEALIFKRGLGTLLDEIRQCILLSDLRISPKVTIKKGQGGTGSTGLAGALNKAIGDGLTSLHWAPRQAPGAAHKKAEVDWLKSIPATLSYGPQELGLGLEVQFGNNYQFNEDLKRLHEAVLEGTIVAGVCVVPSDELAKYKADHGAHFSDARSKLDRYLAVLSGSGAAILPGFVLIGVSQDGFTDVPDGRFSLKAPIFDSKKGLLVPPINYGEYGTIH